jgi:hypothetical protein
LTEHSIQNSKNSLNLARFWWDEGLAGSWSDFRNWCTSTSALRAWKASRGVTIGGEYATPGARDRRPILTAFCGRIWTMYAKRLYITFTLDMWRLS